MALELGRPFDHRPQGTKPKPWSGDLAKAGEGGQPRPRPTPLDIRMVSGNGFMLSARQQGIEVFSITLDGLDRMITDRQQDQEHQPADLEPEESLKDKVPSAYHSRLAFFSKRESDTLAPHRSIDHKIELTEDNTLGFCHLNKHLVEELKTMRDYLTANLGKGFVVSSKAPFASPVLFARKADGSLRFCVDYRKLNALTKKNRYPLPLIDKTLARLSKAKVYTKLDIRQAFHRIRISPELEELIAF
jgi:hypothetical protein